MRRTLNFLPLVCGLVLLVACGKEDRDDTVLNTSDLTGKFWYNNRWLGDPYSYVKEDVLQVIKFEKNGVLSLLDFGGRTESVGGAWTSKNNEIALKYNNGKNEVWNVMHSGNDYIRPMVNGGERNYVTNTGFLENLTADAFLVNDYNAGNRYQTHIGADVRGNRNLREATLILGEGQTLPLTNEGYFWNERIPVTDDYIDFNGQEKEVRFYLKIGKNEQVKLSDRIFSYNLPVRAVADFALNAVNTMGVTTLTVTWSPFAMNDVFYRVEIFNEQADLTAPYFVSRIQPAGSRRLDIKSGTAGEVNRMAEMKSGVPYVVRLSAIRYEPEVDRVNDEYAYANVQAVTYITKRCVWE